jgi:hypothetical protein
MFRIIKVNIIQNITWRLPCWNPRYGLKTRREWVWYFDFIAKSSSDRLKLKTVLYCNFSLSGDDFAIKSKYHKLILVFFLIHILGSSSLSIRPSVLKRAWHNSPLRAFHPQNISQLKLFPVVAYFRLSAM